MNELITGCTFMYSDPPVAYWGLEWFCCGKEITWKESALEPTKATAGGIVPSQVNTGRQFIPTEQSSLNINWLRKPHPAGPPGLYGLHIDQVALRRDEFLAHSEN